MKMTLQQRRRKMGKCMICGFGDLRQRIAYCKRCLWARKIRYYAKNGDMHMVRILSKELTALLQSNNSMHVT